MPAERPRASDDGPPSRAEQQRRTRDALIASARAVFARDGYHGASLGTVSREAGLSKGAVYSNFEGKAALFLAVMDADMAPLDPDSWDLIPRYEALEKAGFHSGDTSHLSAEEQEALGFALATFEFIASAARDPDLKQALGLRLERFRAAFAAVAGRQRASDDPLDADELGGVLMAFDQGLMALAVAGWAGIDADTARRAVARMLRPVDDEDPAR